MSEAGTTTAITTVGPVQAKDRIFNLDMLRGFAVLGILAVNAATFAWPVEVMMSEAPPPVDLSQADWVGFWAADVFFSDKMRTLFTLLFGVSVFLVGGETRDRDRGPLLTRRLLWLGLFGLLHGMIWYGDILLHYAYCGLLFMLCRSWSAKRLLSWGGGITVLWGVIATLGYLAIANAPAELADQMRAGQPASDPETIAAVVQAYGNGAFGWFTQNVADWAMFQLALSPFLIPITVPLMMLGLGLYKIGFFSGKAPMALYLVLLVVGGLNLAAFAVLRWQDVMAGPDVDPTRGWAAAMGGMAPLISLFYASSLILLARFGLKPLLSLLAPVGRMAFTNYLTQTLIMASLYYLPWGPFWFGQQGPAAIWMSVGAIWLLQIVWSPLWLSRFTMGPFEWLWRRVTYKGPVPLRRAALPAAA